MGHDCSISARTTNHRYCCFCLVRALIAVDGKESSDMSSTAVQNPIPVPESLLKKRKTDDKQREDRAVALKEKKKVSNLNEIRSSSGMCLNAVISLSYDYIPRS